MNLKIFTSRNSKKNFDKLSVILEDGEKREKIDFVGKGSIKLAANKKEESDSDMELFTPLNEYFDVVLSDDQKKKLFDFYKAASIIIEDGDFTSYQKEMNHIEPLILGAMELIKPQNLMNFFEHSSKFMVIPKDLKRTPGGGYYPIETTFLVSDYIELVKLTLLIRVVHPIFFGLLSRLESMTGSSYAELVCGALLKKNPHVTETLGWKRLSGYVNHSFIKNNQSNTSTEVGSSEYAQAMILYRIIFNRLCMAKIPETDPGKSIINAISSEVKQYENNIGGYRKKESFGDDDDNTSFLDEHAITEEIPLVKITQMAEYFSFGLRDEKDDERFHDRFKYQCIGFGINNPLLVEAIYDRLPTAWQFQLTKPMKVIMQLVFAGDISERIYDSCDYLQLTAAICLAQAKLSEKGYVYLPSLCCAQMIEGAPQSGNSFLQLSGEDRAFLGELCDVQSKNNEGGSFNEAVLFVKEFFEELESNHWRSNLEYGVLDNPSVYQNVKRGELFDIEIETEIKTEFFRLIAEVNQ